MNTALEQIKPETIALIEAQAETLGLSMDEYLRRLLPDHEKELALKADPPETRQLRSATNSAVEIESDRQKSIAWIQSHREEYGGLYVALRGDVLIATGKNYSEVLRIVHQKGYNDAFVGDVLPPDYEGFLGGWD